MEGIQHPPLVKRLQLNPVRQYHSCLQRKKANRGEKKGKNKLCLWAYTPQYTQVQGSSLYVYSICVIYKKYAYLQGPLQFYYIMPKISCATKHITEDSVDLKVACGSKLNKLSFYSLSPKVFRINCRSFSDPTQITM